MRKTADLPLLFCWTRFGTEAGEPVEAILARKERERRANHGLFFWGIGNSVAAGVAELVRVAAQPEVLFSPIRSRPRAIDVSPPARTRWHGGVTLSGERVVIPDTANVISGRANGPHYALVCATNEPLRPAERGRLHFSALRNLLTGNPVGMSQVTAVVERLPDRAGGREYVVALQASLVPPYFLRLTDPVIEPTAEEGEAA